VDEVYQLSQTVTNARSDPHLRPRAMHAQLPIERQIHGALEASSKEDISLSAGGSHSSLRQRQSGGADPEFGAITNSCFLAPGLAASLMGDELSRQTKPARTMPLEREKPSETVKFSDRWLSDTDIARDSPLCVTAPRRKRFTHSGGPLQNLAQLLSGVREIGLLTCFDRP